MRASTSPIGHSEDHLSVLMDVEEGQQGGTPLRPLDLLRRYDQWIIRDLFAAGLLIKSERRRGDVCEATVETTMPTATLRKAAHGNPPNGPNGGRRKRQPRTSARASVLDETQEQYLRRAYPEGVSFTEMAEVLNLSSGTVLMCAMALKLERRPRPRKVRSRAAKQHEGGVLAWRIARHRKSLVQAMSGVPMGDAFVHRAIERRAAIGSVNQVLVRRIGRPERYTPTRRRIVAGPAHVPLLDLVADRESLGLPCLALHLANIPLDLLIDAYEAGLIMCEPGTAEQPSVVLTAIGRRFHWQSKGRLPAGMEFCHLISPEKEKPRKEAAA